jgi:hypothetical protein
MDSDMDSDNESSNFDDRKTLAKVVLSQYLTNLSQAELDQVLQNRRCKEERDRLQTYLTSDKCPIKSLDLNRMDVLEATSSGEIRIKAVSATAVDTNFSRTYGIGQNILEIRGRYKGIYESWQYYQEQEWDDRMDITYCGQTAAAWHNGTDIGDADNLNENYGADSEAFKEIFRKLREALGIDEPVDDVFRGFMIMFWGPKLCNRNRETRNRLDWKSVSRAVCLWERALGIENEEQLDGYSRAMTLEVGELVLEYSGGTMYYTSHDDDDDDDDDD